jgi:hypothetical protein
MIDIIIFSKDRACQLDALLRSIDNKFEIDHTITVLYKYSNENFRLGYNKLIDKFTQIKFVNETIFRENLFKVLKTCNNKLISFLVDDIIMTETLDEINFINDFYNNNDILSISLRLGKNTNYCYAMNIPMEIPNLANNIWSWHQYMCRGDWGYPMSVDGNIYRKDEFIKYIQNISFEHPCKMEAHMTGNPINKPLMMCFNKSKLINVPLNRVVSWNNRCMNSDLTAEKLNELYLSGKQINIEKIFGINNNSCHYEVQLELE